MIGIATRIVVQMTPKPVLDAAKSAEFTILPGVADTAPAAFRLNKYKRVAPPTPPVKAPLMEPTPVGA